MKEQIIIIAKTYPNLSRKYEETVCVGGITTAGEWVRLFPIRFRNLRSEQKFRKFDLIEADISKTTDKFSRRESHKVDDSSIKVVGSVPKENWEERKKILLKFMDKSIEELESKKKSEHKTFGIIKPKKIVSFYKKPINECREWERELIEGTQTTLNQIMTGEKYRTPLEKIPYWLGYNFYCDDETCKGHNMMCEDWEVLELFRSMKQKYGDDETAFKKVKEKVFDWMLEKRDLYFVVGTESRWNKFLIVSLFYPPASLTN